jgi:hypothetical protein
MVEAKGNCVVYLREEFKKKDASYESLFLNKLSAEETNLYKSGLTTNWYSAEIVGSLYEKAAPMFFPNDPNGVIRIANGLAHDNVNGIYKFLMRTMTIEWVANQSHTLWSKYCRNGKGVGEVDSKKKIFKFILSGCPNVPISFRKMTAGYISGLVELIGGSNPRVTFGFDESDPLIWTAVFS